MARRHARHSPCWFPPCSPVPSARSLPVAVTVGVYSDFVCPYCFLAEFPLREAIQGKDVTVEWLPFELRPDPGPTLRPEGDYLQQAWSRSVYPLAARMGVPIRLPSV